MVAADIGGTKIRAGAVAEGVPECVHEVPTPASEGAVAVLDRVCDIVSAVVEEARAELTEKPALGVGAAGVIDPETGRVLSATEAIQGWAGTHLKAELEKRLTMPVRVINDVHAHALGEANSGAARGTRSSLLAAAGTGIGGGLIAHGCLVSGRHAAAGHIGHMPVASAHGLPCPCGGEGHVEAIASGPAVLSAYRRSGGGHVLSTRELASRARAGDVLARTTFAESGRALGSLLGGLANVLSPEVIVVGGGLAETDELWWPYLRTSYEDELIPAVRGLPLRAAELGGDAALVGAATLWTHPKCEEDF